VHRDERCAVFRTGHLVMQLHAITIEIHVVRLT
jgi:hypothetical protein